MCVTDEIASIEYIGELDTYDLEIDHPEHTFYANGISVSNSHSIAYSSLSFQCAYLLTYYPAEWCAAFLDKEPEEKKANAISLVKGLGYDIKTVDINSSGREWEVLDEKTIVQPLTSLKGLADTAMNQIELGRPFKTIEDLLFNPKVSYTKLNKKVLDVLCRSGATDCLIDKKRFTGTKHFWTVAAVHRPKTKEELETSINLFKDERDFTEDEKLYNIISLTGIYPLELVISQNLLRKLTEKGVFPVSKFDEGLEVCWGIPVEIETKTTKNNKEYYIVTLTDDTFAFTKIKVWGVNSKKDKIYLHHPYVISPRKDDWGMSTTGISKWKMLV
jgi:DNA polymerase III alpha subunit